MPAKDGQEADVDVITVGSWLLSRRGQSKRCAGGHDDASYGFMIDDIPEKLIILPTIVIANALLHEEKPDVQCMLAAVSIAYGKVSDWVIRAHN